MKSVASRENIIIFIVVTFVTLAHCTPARASLSRAAVQAVCHYPLASLHWHQGMIKEPCYVEEAMEKNVECKVAIVSTQEIQRRPLGQPDGHFSQSCFDCRLLSRD